MTDDLEKRLLRVGERVPVPCPDGIKGCLVAHYRIETNSVCREAAATIAALKAEIERLTEREAQAKLDGVRAGIEASMQECLHTGRSARRNNAGWCMINIGNLDAEVIAKGIITADALSDLIAGDADLIVPDTLADSDGDDGA